MNTKRIVAALCGLLLASSAHAQYEITRYVIAGGGGQSAAGAWELRGTIGQANAGAALTSGDWALNGGFWTAAPGAPCFGDTNGDDLIDLSDLSIVLSQFGMVGPGLQGDLTGDDIVALGDLAIVLSLFGASCL